MLNVKNRAFINKISVAKVILRQTKTYNYGI